MFEPVIAPSRPTQEQYNKILFRVNHLIKNDQSIEIKLKHIADLLFDELKFSWIGFYQIKNHEIQLGPFQHNNLFQNSLNNLNVCRLAYNEERIVLVEDVEVFPGHILLDEGCRSEIALPAFKNGEVVLLLYASSHEVDYFTKIDKVNLAEVMGVIESIL